MNKDTGEIKKMNKLTAAELQSGKWEPIPDQWLKYLTPLSPKGRIKKLTELKEEREND